MNYLRVVLAAGAHALYPDSPKDLDKLAECSAIFASVAKEEGFKVHCKTK